MATPRKRPEDKLPTGRPSTYEPRYCQMLIDHMQGGGSIESFAGTVRCAISTVYNWFELHPEFSEARKAGQGLLHGFYENLGKMICSGQLRRVKSETPVIGEDGKPVLDPNTGQVLMKREYEPATAGQSTWIFMCKNMLGWRDKKDVEVSGKDGGPISFSDTTNAELEGELAALIAKAAAKKK